MRAVLAGLFALLFVSGAEARPLTASEQSTLNATRDKFFAAFETADYAALIDVMPPKMLSHIAQQAKVPEPALREKMVELFQSSLSGIEFSNLRMVTEGLEAEDVSHDGKSYVWGFAPTHMEMRIGDEVTKVDAQTVALLDGGKWYLVRTSEMKQVLLMRAVYPFFENVAFPGAEFPEAQ